MLVSIYTHHIDTPALFRFNAGVKTVPLPKSYRQLQRRLASLGFLSQGGAFERKPSQQGSRYVWTRKVRGKTVTVALSEQQFHWLRQAVANQRELDKIVSQMQVLSRQTLFSNLSSVPRRKRLSRKVLGTI
jgi:virulence-associated protein VapD